MQVASSAGGASGMRLLGKAGNLGNASAAPRVDCSCSSVSVGCWILPTLWHAFAYILHTI